MDFVLKLWGYMGAAFFFSILVYVFIKLPKNIKQEQKELNARMRDERITINEDGEKVTLEEASSFLNLEDEV
jgi:uncharacterized membrane-anchored protein YhcB (DUF1043 family)